MNNTSLQTRWHILRSIREFFWTANFIEVETPLIVSKPGMEPHLSPMELIVHNESSQASQAYLHTSPEYAMKKLLGYGYKNIFTICKTFRDKESFGGTHHPEFTMIEWYRNRGTMEEIMNDCERLFQHLASTVEFEKAEYAKDDLCMFFRTWERKTMKELWQEVLNINLDDHLTSDTLATLSNKLGIPAAADEPYEDVFFKIFLNKIESTLGQEKPLILSHYPAQMAALATKTKDGLYANRFEIYVKGLEIANAFQELCNPTEQRARFEKEQEERKKLGKPIFPIDEELISTLEYIDSAAGIALGIDRLVMIFTGCQNINDVLAFPLSKQFTIDH